MQYTVKQAAEKLKVSVFMVRRWIQSGVLPARKKNPLASAGNSPYLIEKADFDKFEKKLTQSMK